MSDRPSLRALPDPVEAATASRCPSDEAILVGFERGEEWAADGLYDRLNPVVERTLRRILHERSADLDDLVQTTFERIVLTLAQQRFAGACSLATWASAIAAHVGIDALRARSRERRRLRQRTSSDPEIAELPAPATLERQLEARAEIARVQGILGRMNPEQARTVVLHDVLGHELSEIAVLTGVTVAAAQSRLVRGRQDLLRRAQAKWHKESR